jgi:hypothetical protein
MQCDVYVLHVVWVVVVVVVLMASLASNLLGGCQSVLLRNFIGVARVCLIR